MELSRSRVVELGEAVLVRPSVPSMAPWVTVCTFPVRDKSMVNSHSILAVHLDSTLFNHVKFGMNGKILKVNKHRKDDMWYIKSITRTPNKIMAMDQKKMDINEAHEKLGHPSERTTRLTIESYGWTATGEFKPCDACLNDKARAKDVSHKPSETVETKPGGRLYLDTTGPLIQSAGGTIYDATLVDQSSSFEWVTHLKAKSHVPEVLDQHAKYLAGKGFDAITPVNPNPFEESM
jgi:hypothetical protein